MLTSTYVLYSSDIARTVHNKDLGAILHCKPGVLNLVLASTTVLFWYRIVLFNIFIDDLLHFQQTFYTCASWQKLQLV
jgi:hypothetical protein